MTTLQQLAETHRLRLVSDRTALKAVVDGKPGPGCEYVPGRRGWITAGKVFLTG
jgi:hypothetical protein